MGPSSASRPSPRGLGPPITPQSSNYTIMNLELLVVFLDEPALVIPGHLNFGPRRMFPKMFLAKPRIPRHSNWTKLAPDPVEDPEVVPPAKEEENPAQEEGDQSCSSRGSRSCSSSIRRRPKLLLPRFQNCSSSSQRRAKVLTSSQRRAKVLIQDPR